MTGDSMFDHYRRLLELAALALAQAEVDDLDQAAATLNRIDRLTAEPLEQFLVCDRFARSAVEALHHLHECPAGVVWAVPDADRYTPPERFARRFIAARANEDQDAVHELWSAAYGAGPVAYVQAVSALVMTTAHLTGQTTR